MSILWIIPCCLVLSLYTYANHIEIQGNPPQIPEFFGPLYCSYSALWILATFGVLSPVSIQGDPWALFGFSLSSVSSACQLFPWVCFLYGHKINASINYMATHFPCSYPVTKKKTSSSNFEKDLSQLRSLCPSLSSNIYHHLFTNAKWPSAKFLEPATIGGVGNEGLGLIRIQSISPDTWEAWNKVR